jgi:16S rRNA (cytosine1402-N4)-methyltransferase
VIEHEPVLLAEALDFLNPAEGDTIVDCTVGGGGHSEAILEKIGESGRLIGIDADEDALKVAGKRLSRFGKRVHLVHGRYEELEQILKNMDIKEIDGALYDLGLSSMQLGMAERGFSYMTQGPLDMRMDSQNKLTAKDVVNNYSEKDLGNIFKKYGEERWASRIAKFIIAARKIKPVENTDDLVKIIKDAIPAGARRRGGHPARKVFQALRIEVNQELKGLKKSIEECAGLLNPGKPGVIISYHSLEDRIAKRTLNQLKVDGIAEILTKKPVKPSKKEIELNPRSRSAVMRAFKKIGS